MRTSGDVRWIVWQLDAKGERSYGEKCDTAAAAKIFAVELDKPYEIEMAVLFEVKA